MRILIVDDESERLEAIEMLHPGSEIVYCPDYYSACTALLDDTKRYDIVYLDFDLGGRPRHGERWVDGSDVAEEIAHMPTAARPARIVLHSNGELGAQEQRRILADAGIQAERVPFLDLVLRATRSRR